ncbi:hypothetical protein BKA69DRAFT_1093055 [Paraphysoderma sedebokerense]|nr:hypothetical protein BKA69DRAFT_1098194 [Paraphysoderma sedebokerense]KAI9138255.1 hypothetical protein BKA69DRAFT_1093055 [Paraphysoderma sedebokerense]
MPPDYSSSSSSSSSSSGSYPYSSSSTYAGNDANIRFSKPSYPLTPPSIYQDIPSNISSIPNPYLPPALPSDAYPDDDDFRIRSSRLNSFLYFATIKYFTTAFVSPFEVAKILLQVQYLPDDETIARQASSLQVENENALGDDELSEHDYGDSEGVRWLRIVAFHLVFVPLTFEIIKLTA